MFELTNQEIDEVSGGIVQLPGDPSQFGPDGRLTNPAKPVLFDFSFNE